MERRCRDGILKLSFLTIHIIPIIMDESRKRWKSIDGECIPPANRGMENRGIKPKVDEDNNAKIIPLILFMAIYCV